MLKPDAPDIGARPPGALAWLHCPNPARRGAVLQLGRRILAQTQNSFVLLTQPAGTAPAGVAEERVIEATLPVDESTAGGYQFLAQWQPDAAVWMTGHLRPGLIMQARRRKVPMLLAEAEESALDDGGWRWRPGRSRNAVLSFDLILAATANAGRRLQRIGADLDRIQITGPLQEAGPPLTVNEDEREELAGTLEGRPSWLAATPGEAELETILDAHRVASRLAHRLLLVLVPFRLNQGPGLARRLRDDGWRLADWAEGEFPREETQILLAEGPRELGLWYRICPVSLMGGTLLPGLRGRDPWEAAVLGSAIIHGPHVGERAAAYDRLARAGGARPVRDGAALTTAISRLIAPDDAATMSGAAWTVATEGAEVTDRVVDWVTEALDRRGSR